MELPDEMYSDRIFVVKKDGARKGPFPSAYGEGKFATKDAEPDIEDGDTIIRLVGKREEVFEVIDCGYSPGFEGVMEPFYNATVRKSTAPAPASKTVSYNTNFHGPVTNAQIGENNRMEVNNAMHTISQIINNSTATPEEKAEAQGVLGKFLNHPAIVAILGGAAGAAFGQASN